MKKKLLALTCMVLAGTFAFASCGKKKDSTVDEGGSVAAPIAIDGFDTSYNPASDKIKKQTGTIDVALVFEGTLDGWKALKAEYERLHGGTAKVNLIDNLTDASVYQQNLSAEIQGTERKWDIVQGNLFQGSGLRNNTINMYTYLNSENPYAGAIDGEVRTWKEVLTKDAYQTDKSASANSTYILNTEGLQTAWFVNTVARDAAKANGYKGSDTPATWDELMDLCKCMEAAGYENPLGIALDKDSIGASQFTWLLRVYGDYYYRNEYQKIMLNETYEYDPTSENPEAATASGYGISKSKFYYSLYAADDTVWYCGPGSDKYVEFISQFEKMKPYLRTSATDGTQSGLAVLRSKFASQSEGTNSPQILLDYAGAGLKFQKSVKEGTFGIDFFDYPAMVSAGNYIPEGTVLRDVGGNGGYLSIIDQTDDAQDELNLDFVKFVASPYGQSIYYKALNETGNVPMGMTTIVNSAVVIPSEWATFFNTDKIKFSGLVDSNPYISNLIRSFNQEDATVAAAISNWQTFLTTDTMPLTGPNSFVKTWENAMEADWKSYCTRTGTPESIRDSRTASNDQL